MGEENALAEAVRILEGQSAVAKVCGGKVKQQHVWWWLNKSGGRVPPEHAPKIAAACREKEPDTLVTPEALCPDFPWDATAEQRA